MNRIWRQLIPIFLAIFTCLGLIAILYTFIHLLNLVPIADKIIPHLRLVDVVVGFTIYIKTAIDFALFIGVLMANFPGWKNRIAIEIGTALGNAIGTLLILAVWTFFKEVPLLLIAMVFIASLVLFRMAQDEFALYSERPTLPKRFNATIRFLEKTLIPFNHFFKPLLSILIPHLSLKDKQQRTWIGLFGYAISIPFILGLDDFAGYIPLFSVINVVGFAIGVFLGHMLLTISLFASPGHTTKIVKQPIVLVFGGVIFLGLALFGFFETYHIFVHYFIH